MSAADSESEAVFELEAQLDAPYTARAWLYLVAAALLVVTSPALVVIAYRAAF